MNGNGQINTMNTLKGLYKEQYPGGKKKKKKKKRGDKDKFPRLRSAIVNAVP
jgi:hypothetical protein